MILTCLRKVEAKGNYETAKRLRAVIGAVFRYAIANGSAETDPTYALRDAIIRPTVTPRAAITDVKALAKRPNPRAIKAARSYTMQEGAEALGVTVGAVRGWIRAGLPVMKAQRPFLILGDALRQFLEDRRGNGKVKLGTDQLYCLMCKQGQSPLGMIKTAFTTAGLCERYKNPIRTGASWCNRY